MPQAPLTLVHRPKGAAPASRAAIVTGASSGIGLEMARELVRLDYAVTIVARTPEKLEEARATLEAEGAVCQAVAGNVGREADVERVVAAHAERFGRLDVLVNNAGVAAGASITEAQTKHVDLQIDVNLRSVVFFYRACVPLLEQAAAETGRSWVLNTSSIVAKQPQRWVSVYAATKAAVVAFTQSMNRELAARGVHSCVICPSGTGTAMMDGAADVAKAVELISPADIASAVPFLLGLSPQCLVSELVMHSPRDRV